MRKKYVFLYLLGVVFLVFGNRNLWDELQDARENNRKTQALIDQNKDLEKQFQVQSLYFDSVQGKWVNPYYYFEVINLGNVNFNALKKKHSHIERHHDEDATESL